MKKIIIIHDYISNTIHRNVAFAVCSNILEYGLQKLGFSTSIITANCKKIHSICDNNIVIVYPHLFSLLDKIKCNIILYNSESLYLGINKGILSCINDPRIIMIWDYEYKNMEKKIKNHFYVPPVYAPIYLPYWGIKQEKDIDILFYGATDPTRHKRRYDIKCNLFKQNTKYNIQWFETFPSLKSKYNLINRSKIVLIVHTYTPDLCIDFFRMTELILLKTFFIHEMPSTEPYLQYEKYKDYIIFSEYTDIINTCFQYLDKSQTERDDITKKIFKMFSEKEKIENYITQTIKDKIM